MGIETLMIAGTIASGVGTVVNTISQMRAASYQQAVAARNAEIANNNARTAEENARRAATDSQTEQRDWGENARQQFGMLMADMAGSGVSMEGGTAGLLRSGTRDLARRDSERVRADGDESVRGFYQQAADFRGQKGDFQAQAVMAGNQKKFALFGGALDLASTYVSHATRTKRSKSLLETRA